ncbi:LysR family transcriptional regulator [Nonomuraea dietziae]|uniref:LysR family transcriptional regulator n=1 Tax=Nonomuraea dietziae TaxID=65515 RepID=UPI00344224B9
MSELELRDLRYFRAVAEELNFSRAAQRLGMAQPPLSRAIQQLERRLGVKLLERTTHHVALTPAGTVLLDEAERVLAAAAVAARRTRRAGSATPSLILTAKPGVATDLLRRITQACDDLPDAPKIDIVVSGYGEQAEHVLDGRADLAVLGSPFDTRGLDIEPLTSEPRVAALPIGHELAPRAVLTRRDLVGLPTPQCPHSTPDQRDYWGGLSSEGPTVRDSSHLLETVALGQAVALIPLSLAERNHRDDIVYRPVADASPYVQALAWRTGERSRQVARLVRAVVELTADEGAAPPVLARTS